MIISHKYRFIFIRPKKLASTSVETNLAKQCGENDIVTPSTLYDPNSDETKYTDLSRNFKEKGFYKHIPPDKIKKKVGQEIWKNYFKFTITRNPYDVVVSRYWWHKTGTPKPLKEKVKFRKIISNMFKPSKYRPLFIRLFKKDKVNSFEEFVDSFQKRWANTRYYFDKKNNPINYDYYIRFENLEEDYKKVCKTLGIPYRKLPRMKTKRRKNKVHYSKYYNEETKKKVHDLFEDELELFDYGFEDRQT